jgi:Arc/MetJ family transcription regulator
MPTNLDIDQRLLERAVQVSGERTKTAAVTRALREYVARHEQKRLVHGRRRAFSCYRPA